MKYLFVLAFLVSCSHCVEEEPVNTTKAFSWCRALVAEVVSRTEVCRKEIEMHKKYETFWSGCEYTKHTISEVCAKTDFKSYYTEDGIEYSPAEKIVDEAFLDLSMEMSKLRREYRQEFIEKMADKLGSDGLKKLIEMSKEKK